MKKDVLYALAISAGAIFLIWGGRKIAMKIKAGAIIDGLTPEMKTGLEICGTVFENRGLEMVVTSGLDSKHGKDTYHTEGNAVDLRLASRLDDDADDATVREEMADALGPDYDVVLEVDHFHVEYDRRRVAKRKTKGGIV